MDDKIHLPPSLLIGRWPGEFRLHFQNLNSNTNRYLVNRIQLTSVDLVPGKTAGGKCAFDPREFHHLVATSYR